MRKHLFVMVVEVPGRLCPDGRHRVPPAADLRGPFGGGNSVLLVRQLTPGEAADVTNGAVGACDLRVRE